MNARRRWRSTVVFSLMTIVLAVMCLNCSRNASSEDQKTSDSDSNPSQLAKPMYVAKGDLADILARDELRVLIPKRNNRRFLPRGGLPIEAEMELVESFAKTQGIQIEWIHTDNHRDLLPNLLAGKGDLVAASLTVTPARKEKVAFSVPTAVIKEQVVVRANDPNPPKSIEELVGRQIAVRRSSSYWDTLTELKKTHPGLRFGAVPETIDTQEILGGVSSGKYDITIADNNLLRAVMAYDYNLKPSFDLSGERATAWAVRPDAPKLLKALDRFLNREKLATHSPKRYRDDFPQLLQRKTLRLITRNSAATYFLWRGKLLGFEYELIRRFAKKHGMRVEVVVPPARGDLIPWLTEGRGDLIAAAMTVTDERRKLESIAPTTPYNMVSEILVARADDAKKIQSLKDLEDRKIVVRRSSSYWSTLEKLQSGGAKFRLVQAPEELETEEIIARVASGEYDLTLADSHILDIELTWRSDVDAAFPLGDPVPQAWFVRADNPQLLAALNQFISEEYKQTTYNILYKKYFKNQRKIRKHIQFRAKSVGQLSPYDDLVKKFAARYGFDWRLIVAQMFEESQFDPNAQSFAGAVGLMQVLPRTGRQYGFKNLHHPETSIHAGTRYLAYLRDRLDSELSVKDRMWMALAAYNAGYGHLFDARRIAEQKGWNPNRWFDHVEKAMLLLSRPAYARRSRYGYARGHETVRYIREIRRRYNAYLNAAPVD